jgi:signal transduction histidine kinase
MTESSPESSIRNRSKEQLEVLYLISRTLNSTLEVAEVLRQMLDLVLDIFEADAGSIMLEREGYLTIEVSQGLDAGIVTSTRQKVGTGIAGWVAQTGQPLHLDGKVDDARFVAPVDRGDDIRSSLCVPVKIRETTVGVVMIRRSGESAFHRRDLAFLETVSDLAAVALQNARLFESERSQRYLLQLEHQKLQATLASMADGVMVVSQEGDVLTANVVARKLLRPLVGSKLSRLWTEHREIFAGPETHLQSGTRSLAVLPTPLYVEGRNEGSVLIFRDETAKRELERMKSEFLSMVSHELKTPITTIGAFLELLLVRDFPPERRNHFLGICQDECQRLHNLIDQLLHLTRLEAGKFALQVQKRFLAPLVRECVPAFAETNPNHRYHLMEPLENPELPMDPMLITQAVTNLLSNATKYSPGGGEVKIGLEVQGKEAIFWVKDQGVGIEAEKLPYVFDKFYRIDNSLTRETGGTGLGLANVKHIAEAHGGRVWAQSTPGEGSQFFVALPLTGEMDEGSCT